MAQNIFKSLFKRTYPKGVGFAASYRNASTPIEDQRKRNPILFLKHLSSLTQDPKEVRLHGIWPIKYEVELGFIIGKGGRNIQKDQALYHIGGYFLLIDFTATEITQARKRGESFCLYKNDDNYFPIGSFIEKDVIKDPDNLDLELKINGQTMQKANTSELVHDVSELISYTSKYLTLNEGDLFLTGTPDGSAEINQDDRIYATLSQEGEVLSDLNFKVRLEV